MSTLACVIWCSRPPNSERDITDTQSRYANRKSYITLNCRRAFQIWRITGIDKKESFTNVEIIPLPLLRYFTAWSVGLRYSLVFTCFSFFISIELVTKSNRYVCVLYLFDVPDDRYRILVNAYFQAWSISRLTAVIHKFSSTDCFKIH